MTGGVRPSPKRFLYSIVSSFQNPSLPRLLGDIERLREELSADTESTDLTRKGYADRCIGFLDKADQSISVWNLDSAWKCYNQAKRHMVNLMDAGSFNAQQTELKHEAEQKLVGWRQKSVLDVLALLKTEQDESVKCALLAEAMKIRDGHNDNLYFRKDRVRSHMVILAIFLAALLVMFLGILKCVDNGQLVYVKDKITWQLLVNCMLLGSIGACLSALMSLSSKDVIPDQFTSVMVTVARPLIGAASGMLAVFFLETELINLGTASAAIWILAFALGFSERLIMGTMEKIGSKNDK